MSITFVENVDGLSVSLGPLHQFTSRNNFAEFYSSSFPVFALGPHVLESDLGRVVDTANKQARAELGFDEAELAEMGYIAAIPQAWQLYNRAPRDAVRWYHEEFDKDGTSDTDDPQWYPLGFLGIISQDWETAGVVLVSYDALHGQAYNKDIPVKAFVVDPAQVGLTLISLRQGDDDYENVKRHSAMVSSTA